MNSVCRMFNMSYNNTLNNRLFKILIKSNIKISQNEFNKIKHNNIDYIVNTLVKKQYNNFEIQKIVIDNINNNLYKMENDNNNLNNILVTKNNNDFNKIKFNRNYHSLPYNISDRLINHYKIKIYDNPHSLYYIKDIKLFNAIMKSTLCVQDYEYFKNQHKSKNDIIDYFINREHEHSEVRKMIKNKIEKDYKSQ